MDKVRIGVVGIGNMGTQHIGFIKDGRVDNVELTAICDKRGSRREWAKANLDGVDVYSNFEDILKADTVDALLIATPHYFHPQMAIKTLQAGKHVLVEKPIGVYTKAVKELIEVAKGSDKVFTIMYNQRTNPIYQKVRQMIQDGELGDLIRVNWVITEWFRTEYYYESGDWRATWKGEGGGVLLNQSPHQLDLIQWLCGMPKRVRGFCSYGKFHNIEVEDDVTAYFEYENGATGSFITSTGEAPGTNRLEISGDKGKVTVEGNKITFIKNEIPTSVQLITIQQGFKKPESTIIETIIDDKGSEHPGIIQNFVDGILSGKKQLAPGNEGIDGLTISNAIHLSSWIDDWVDLPFDEDKFYVILQQKIADSTVVKQVKDGIIDLAGSH